MIGISQIVLSSIGGAIFTISINEIIKSANKRNDLRNQKNILIAFLDEIVIKYLNINLEQYKELLSDLGDDEKLFAQRKFTLSPMLNKNIFDFFERKDLIKIFNYCKKNSIVKVYHNFYEIEFLKNKSPFILLDNFKRETEDHYEVHKLRGEEFEEHLLYCANYKKDKQHFKDEMEINVQQIKSLIESFEEIKKELLNIEELTSDY